MTQDDVLQELVGADLWADRFGDDTLRGFIKARISHLEREQRDSGTVKDGNVAIPTQQEEISPVNAALIILLDDAKWRSRKEPMSAREHVEMDEVYEDAIKALKGKS